MSKQRTSCDIQVSTNNNTGGRLCIMGYMITRSGVSVTNKVMFEYIHG